MDMERASPDRELGREVYYDTCTMMKNVVFYFQHLQQQFPAVPCPREPPT